ncbi:MAG: hypothetical protein IJ735_04420 [Clostridia bacterium]|nr:hypothetical protein [Clostridia bacterium]
MSKRKKKKSKRSSSRPRQEDLRNMTMALKDESETQKALTHPELIP